MTALSLPIYNNPALAPVRDSNAAARRDSITAIERAAASLDDRIERCHGVASDQFDLRNAFDIGHAIKSAIASLIAIGILVLPFAIIVLTPRTKPWSAADSQFDWAITIVFGGWALMMLLSLVAGAVFFARPVWQVLSRGFSYTFLQRQMHVARQLRAIGHEAVYVHGENVDDVEVIRYDAIGSIFVRSGEKKTTAVVVDGRDGKTISWTDGWFKEDAERFVETVSARIPKVAEMTVKD